jgi:hypothetical protein
MAPRDREFTGCRPLRACWREHLPAWRAARPRPAAARTLEHQRLIFRLAGRESRPERCA